jgi:Ca-activated chloride channel family protein
MSHLDDLAAWDPDQGDLPDHLAAALDADPALRAAFDARFAPADLADASPMPADLAVRLGVAPVANRRRWAPWLAMAAAATLAVGLVARDGPLAQLQGARLAAEVERQEAALRDEPGGEFSEAQEHAASELSALGYISRDLGADIAAARRAEAERRARVALGYGVGADGAIDPGPRRQLQALGYDPSIGNELGRVPPSDPPTIDIVRGGVRFDHAQRDDGAVEQLRALGYADGTEAGNGAAPAVPGEVAGVVGGVVGGVPGGVIGGVLGGVAGNSRSGARTDAAGEVLTKDFLSQIPTGRAYQQAVQLDPDVATPTETYTDYGRNPRQLTATDPLSTFAVDVDTASYTLIRRKLTEGKLPRRAAVRVEEVLNRFHYDDPAPTTAPFAVRTEGTPSPWTPGTHLVRVGVQGRAPGPRQPAHLTFLVDTSGSMTSPDKLGLVQHGLRQLVSQLRPVDTVAIVAYAGSAGVVLDPTPGDQQRRILAAIDNLRAGGSTAMGAGIQAAYDLADQTRAVGHTNRVILLSDGDANVGETRHGPLTDSIRHYAARGIALTTVGVGDGNYRDTTMEQLANDGDGTYVYLDTPEEARRVFVDELPTTLDVLARDVKIQVAWDASVVTWYRLVGYENRDLADADFRRDAVDAGEVNAGHHVTALYEVQLAPGATGPLGTVRLRYKPPGPDAPATEAAWPLTLGPTTPGHDLHLAIAAASFAEKLRGGLPELPWSRVESLAADVAVSPDEKELLRLIRTAAELAGEGRR